MPKNGKKTILIIFGTRPEAIKMAPLVIEFKKNEFFNTKVCVTGQHRQMLYQVLDFFEIKPDYDLDIMKPNQDLYDITANILLKTKDVLEDADPDIVFVHGDTSTTFSCSLAAFYKKIDIAHIEAGLRTGNLYSPWPEEANRKLTSQLTKLHFAPTESSKTNLLNEQVNPNTILVTGNTVIDALLVATNKIASDTALKDSLFNQIHELGYEISPRPYILVTGHRRENFGQGFINICEALKTIAHENPNYDIVYPVHLNPNVQEHVYNILSGISNIYLIKPLDYLPFVALMSKSDFILTDSGGIQEEAPSLGKPVLVMRDTTERPEAVTAGTVKLVGTDKEFIIKESSTLIHNRKVYNEMSSTINPYGNGEACQKIIEFTKNYLLNKQ